jgi:NADPH2:quinone reductase
VVERAAGRKASVVYDSVGLATHEASADALAPFGLLVIYGASSGPTPALDPEWLNRKGCLFLTRPSVFPHNAAAADLQANAREVFEAWRSGAIKLGPVVRYSLAAAAEAHRHAEAKRSTGSIVLLPQGV